MKPHYLLLLCLFPRPVVCSAAVAPESGSALFSTNFHLSLRLSADQIRQQPPKDGLGRIRLSLDVDLGKPQAGSWFERARGPLERVPGSLASPGVEWAERLDADAMRRQRERWMDVLKAPWRVRVSANYPSQQL